MLPRQLDFFIIFKGRFIVVERISCGEGFSTVLS